MEHRAKQKNFLSREELNYPVRIHEWLDAKTKADNEHRQMYYFLTRHAEYFDCKYLDYVDDIPRLTKDDIKVNNCHSNALQYAQLVYTTQPEAISTQFKFVTGLQRSVVKDNTVPQEACCVISHHSFLAYKGKVLDPTALAFPPKNHNINQYFGVSYSLQNIVNIMQDLIEFSVKKSGVPLIHRLQNRITSTRAI